MTRQAHEHAGSSSLAVLARGCALLDLETETALARQAAAGSRVAFDRLVSSHMRLVVAIANEFGRFGLPHDDLVSEGALGLVEATHRFDPERGVRLAAYAAWWIRAFVRRYAACNRRIVRAPSTRNGRKLLSNLRKTQRELTQCGKVADGEAVAAALGVLVSDVVEMEGALSGRDIPISADPDATQFEPVDESPSPEAWASERQARNRSEQDLAHALGQLDKRELAIVRGRYLSDERASLAEIGRDLGLSRERVRQLEGRAQQKMRSAMLQCAS